MYEYPLPFLLQYTLITTLYYHFFSCITNTIEIQQPALVYLGAVYRLYTASAIASYIVLRSLAGGLLPLAASGLVSSLGYGWGNTILAIIALPCALMPLE